MVIFLIAAVQFVNVLDFMMVMPLGPDFAKSLAIPASHLGWVAGSYTAAASVAGLLGSFFLDRFDRRLALAASMTGLVLGTASGGFAINLGTLLTTRVIAGLFGGPATSVALSIVADTVPAERRGRALGAVMGAFSVASVLGVPAGLWLAQHGGWRIPFWALAGMGTVVTAASLFFLPPQRAHLSIGRGAEGAPSMLQLLGRKEVRLSYLMTAVTMAGGFLVVPNLSAYVQMNLGYPRNRLDLLYVAGGVMSFGAMRLVGRLVDRYGSFRIGSLGVAFLMAVLYVGFFREGLGLPVVLLFLAFMLATNFRNVAYNTLTSKVPRGNERARFMSLQSSVQHAASATGAGVSSILLADDGHRLLGMPKVALLAMLLNLLLPVLLWVVERRVTMPSPSTSVKATDSERCST